MQARTDRQGALQPLSVREVGGRPRLEFFPDCFWLICGVIGTFPWEARKRPRNGPAVWEELENVRNGLERLEKA